MLEAFRAFVFRALGHLALEISGSWLLALGLLSSRASWPSAFELLVIWLWSIRALGFRAVGLLASELQGFWL